MASIDSIGFKINRKNQNGRKMVMGSSSGKLTIEKSQDLAIKWKQKFEGNIYKIGFEKVKVRK